MPKKPKDKRVYRVTERVVFEYTYLVRATTKDCAREIVNEHGDGEAIDHAEIARRVSTVEIEACVGYPKCKRRHVHGREADIIEDDE